MKLNRRAGPIGARWIALPIGARWIALCTAVMLLAAAAPSEAARKRRKKRKKARSKAKKTKVVAPEALPPAIDYNAPAEPDVVPAEGVMVFQQEPETGPIHRRHSLNLSVAGAVIGDWALVYGWMFAPGHALMAGYTVAWLDDEEGGEDRGMGGQVGYRYYTKGHNRSYFVGLMAGYDVGYTTSRRRSTHFVGDDQVLVQRVYKLPSKRWRATLSLGRRWVFGPGLQFTSRLGIGPGKRTYNRGGTQEADHEAKVMENIINSIPLSLDIEQSIGWLF